MTADANVANLYDELEVQATDDVDTIKKSYRRLVLKYHPDKNPEDRSFAEEKIRKINTAYETLSVPAKRQLYDMQINSMRTKKSGVHVDTTLVQPRFAIPKFFMMCPMGHPDKFVRTVGTRLVLQSRADVSSLGFDAFFQAAKFGLWWLKADRATNMCRLIVRDDRDMFLDDRASGGGGSLNGFNFSFVLGQDSACSDVTLSPMENPHATRVVAQVSPEYPGAFRFEAALWAGCHLAFQPPDGVKMMRKDESCIIDFMLLDYNSAEKHRTLDEILVPVMLQLQGHINYVRLTDICKHQWIIAYFRDVLGGHFWDCNDFALHFHAHDDKWQYNESLRMVKLRSLEEQIAGSLKRAHTPAEAVRALSKKGDSDLRSLPLDSLAVGLEMLSAFKIASSEPIAGCKDAQIILLTLLTLMCSKADRTSPKAFLQYASLWDSLSAFAGNNSDVDVVNLVSAAQDALIDLTSHMLQLKETAVDAKLLELVLSMPLKWDICGEQLSKKSQGVVIKLPVESIVPLIRMAASTNAVAVGECLAASTMMKLLGVDAAVALDALDAMVSGGFGLEGAPMMLSMLLAKAHPELAARIVAGLAEHNVSGPNFDTCWEAVVLKEGALAALPPQLRKRLEDCKKARERSRSRQRGSKTADKTSSK